MQFWYFFVTRAAKADGLQVGIFSIIKFALNLLSKISIMGVFHELF